MCATMDAPIPVRVAGITRFSRRKMISRAKSARTRVPAMTAADHSSVFQRARI